MAGLPVSLTSGSAQGSFAPVPLVVVGGTPAASTTVRGGVLKVSAPAAAPSAFADLTAAATAYNAMRTALINAGVFQ